MITPDARSSRSQASGMFPMLDISKSTFISDGIKAQVSVKGSITYTEAKNQIKIFVKTITIRYLDDFSTTNAFIITVQFKSQILNYMHFNFLCYH